MWNHPIPMAKFSAKFLDTIHKSKTQDIKRSLSPMINYKNFDKPRVKLFPYFIRHPLITHTNHLKLSHKWISIYLQDLLRTHLMDTSGHLQLLEFWCSLREFFLLSCCASRQTTHNSQSTGKDLNQLTKYNAELVFPGVKILSVNSPETAQKLFCIFLSLRHCTTARCTSKTNYYATLFNPEKHSQ